MFMQLPIVDPAQITRLTWKGNTQPNYGGNTFQNRVYTAVAHIKAGIANLEDYQCYTFNGSENITAQFQQEVNKVLNAPGTYTPEEIQRMIYKITGKKSTVSKMTGSMKNYTRFKIKEGVSADPKIIRDLWQPLAAIFKFTNGKNGCYVDGHEVNILNSYIQTK